MICPGPNCNTNLTGKYSICPVCGTNVEHLTRIAELPDYYFNHAIEAFSHQQWFESIELLGATIALNPGDIDAILLLGNLYLKIGQLEQAKRQFLKALGVDAKNQYVKSAIRWLQENGVKFSLDEL